MASPRLTKSLCELCGKPMPRDDMLRIHVRGEDHLYHFDCAMEATKPHPATKEETLERLGIKGD